MYPRSFVCEDIANASQLEELDKVFEAKNPVKFSTATHKLALTEDNTVVAIDDDVKI